ncbi:MAG: hypothetical protein WBO34_13270 [Gammaproteobacteria bacterium]
MYDATIIEFEEQENSRAARRGNRRKLKRNALARKKIERWYDRRRLRSDLTEVW